METSTHARIKGFRQLFAFAIGGGGIQGIIFAGGGGYGPPDFPRDPPILYRFISNTISPFSITDKTQLYHI